ncbi:type 1 glutamine amidotransferase [Erythrobacter litoralis]|uniref:type 1 glutamine amidotransferase n=1 Tax=Erythrobacter litoralis TaxID=39960 RepID=UPI002435552A|nr:type 1 glutamine amidotransferase [Erythrobacter litoralis]MDG6080186.1 type 1 glutamine amidotransferase [Erythrobacter litoralis]
MTILIAESGTSEDRAERRDDVGKSSGETYAATLRQLMPGARFDIVRPSDEGASAMSAQDVAAYDAIFITGSPMHVYNDTPPVRRQIEFMQAVFASGTPSFGSCAGLQVAVAAAGGKVRRMPERLEAGISRGLVRTAAGEGHPLLEGRPAVWDAPALHGDEVEHLPENATLLAGNRITPIQAAEIRHDRGIFWGVQYHPELAIGEIAAALRRECDALVDAGLAEGQSDVGDMADRLDRLHREPDRRSCQWLLGVDDEFADETKRRTELLNFIAAIPSLDRREG